MVSTIPFPLNHPNTWCSTDVSLWLNKVALKPTQLATYTHHPHPVMLIHGSAGSGVSTTLDLIRVMEQAHGNFVVTSQLDEDILYSIFRSVSIALEREIVARDRIASPCAAGAIDENLLPVWYWLLETYCFQSNRFVTRRWFQRYFGICDTTVYEHLALEIQALQPSLVVDLLLDIVNNIGYQDIVCVIEKIPPNVLDTLQTALRPMVTDPRGLRVVIGVTTDAEVSGCPNTYFPKIQLTWTWEMLWQICYRMVSTALGQSVEIPVGILQPLESLLSTEVGQTPQAIKILATTFYWLFQKYKYIPTNLELLKQDLYERSIPLRYDPQAQILFRGIKPLSSLTDAPLQLFEYLYFHRDRVVDSRELITNAYVGSNGNLYQLIRRIREVIEPSYTQRRWIYLFNHYALGFSLHNCV